MKAFIKWGLLALVIGGGVYYWLSSDSVATEDFRLNITQPVRGDFVSKVQATGTLEPQELVDVGAQVTGEIKEFGVDVNGKRVDYGSEVKAGQLLARIDDTIVELDIKRAEASVAQAKAQILSASAGLAQAKASISQATANKNKADRDLARAKKLGVGDALSQMSYDQYVNAAETAAAGLESAQAQLQTAEAQQASAEAQLQSAQAQLESELRNRDYTRITTPVDGTIVVRQVNVGQTVVSSMNATTLFLVARDLTKMQIWTSVNEADIAKVKPGQEVRYTVDALPNKNFVGVVNKIRPNATMTSNVVTYIVEVDIENPDRILLPYMSANANFIVKEVKDVLMVQDAAFDFRPSPDMIDEKFRKERQRNRGPRPEVAAADEVPAEGAEAPAEPEGERAIIWRKVSDKTVAPVRVRKLESDGTRTVVVPADGETFDEKTQIVTGKITITAAEKASGGMNNPFGHKRPQRRQRGAGGVEAKPGQGPSSGSGRGPRM